MEMKFNTYACSATLLAWVVIAAPRNKNKAHDNNYNITIMDMPTRSIMSCPLVEWRPLSPYKSVAFPDAWWFLPDADAANQAHYEVTHTSLPSGIVLPNPLLPTNNATVKEFYSFSIKAYEEDEMKQKKLGNQDCQKWLHALNKFHIMCRCVHMWWWQCTQHNGEKMERIFDTPVYEARYRKLKGLLDDQMKKEGLIALGKHLKETMPQEVEGLGLKSTGGGTPLKRHDGRHTANKDFQAMNELIGFSVE